ncbi:hypothetical protein TrRE_jg9680, partial [Triparma retinervis]
YASKYPEAPRYTSLGRSSASSPTNPFLVSHSTLKQRFKTTCKSLTTFSGMAHTIGAMALFVLLFWAVFEACRRI